jgi:hypothetical protein
MFYILGIIMFLSLTIMILPPKFNFMILVLLFKTNRFGPILLQAPDGAKIQRHNHNYPSFVVVNLPLLLNLVVLEL